MPRAVFPGVAHHLTQRGVDRQAVFFADRDRQVYLQLVQRAATQFGVSLVGYCLMPNHVHWIAVPKSPVSLTKTFAPSSRSLCPILQFAAAAKRTLLAEPLLFVCFGRRAPVGRAALCRAEPGAIGAARHSGGLDMVERGGPRRPARIATVARPCSLAIEVYTSGMDGLSGGRDVRWSRGGASPQYLQRQTFGDRDFRRADGVGARQKTPAR